MRLVLAITFINAICALVCIVCVAQVIPSQRVTVVNPDPRVYHECSPVLSCKPRTDAPTGPLSHDGIRVSFGDVVIGYGTPEQPCHPWEEEKSRLILLDNKIIPL